MNSYIITYLYKYIIFVRYSVIVIGLEANSIGPLQRVTVVEIIHV